MGIRHRVGIVLISTALMLATAHAAPLTPSATLLVALVKSGSIGRLEAYLATPGVSINDRPDNDKALLDYAAEQNQVDIARYLLDHGASINAEQTHGLHPGLTALGRAAYFGSLGVAQLLIARGAAVNGVVGLTPLMYAASGGSIPMVKLLLAHGADPDAQTRAGQSPGSVAAESGHLDIVRLLQAHGGTPDPRSLIAAASAGQVASVAFLLSEHPGSDALDQALRFAILIDRGGPQAQEQIIRLLIAHGANVNNRADHAQNSPLMLANSAAVVDLLVAHGAEVNAVTPWGSPVEALACNKELKDPVAAFQVLLAHGADLKTVTPKSRSALDCAVSLNRLNFAQFLLVHGTPVDIIDGRGRTALFYAADPAIIKLLLAHGANINAVDYGGLTPLTSALTDQRESLALSLVASGAQVDAVPRASQLPLTIAVKSGSVSVVVELLEHGADPNGKDARGESALEGAIEAGQEASAQALIARGADVNARGPMGWTPLHYAAKRNDGPLVSLLLAHGAISSETDNERLPPEAQATATAVRSLFEARLAGSVGLAGRRVNDAHACEEVVRRTSLGTLGQIVEPGDAPSAPGDPSEDWDYLDQVSQPESVRLLGQSYVLGMSKQPKYLARVGRNGLESIVCEYAVSSEDPPRVRVMTMLERLQARSSRDFQSVSLESLKVVGLAGARALLEASRRQANSIPLAGDSDSSILGDAIIAHRDDILRFYLDHGVDPNLGWRPHRGIDGAESALDTAVQHGSAASILMLLGHGANPNFIVGAGWEQQPTLSWALQNAALPTVELLLDYGADPTLASTFFTTTKTLQGISRDDAQAEAAANAVRLLLARGADPNAWIWVAFQTVAHEKARDDLLTLANASRPMAVKTAWINSLLSTGGDVDPSVSALLSQAAAVRDSGDCPQGASADVLERCLPNSLRSADEALNARYRQLSLPGGPPALKLRDAQREWLRERDKRCGLSEIVSSNEGGWISYVLADQMRAVCVLDATRQRLSSLNESVTAPSVPIQEANP